jgi:CO dehydrogenase/acetyl-CoA synthase epsilon subunit
MTKGNRYQKARAVLQSLIQGLDPETGAELPKDTIVNRIEVNRSMLVAVTAMEQVAARVFRRAQLPESVGKTWTDEEEQQLKAEFANSEPIPLIATKHGRTIRAIEARLELLGLLSADQHTTSNSFTGSPSRKDSQ